MKKTIQLRSKYFIKSCANILKSNDNVLDVGSGNGIMAMEFKKHFNCNITSTDILNYTKVELPFVKMNDPSKLPFSDKEFNIVMLIDMLHHTDDSTQKLLLSESKRVGESILIFETRPTLKANILDHVLNYIHEKKMNIPLNFKNESYWKNLLENLKFNDVKYFNVDTPIYYPLSHFGFFAKC